MKKDAIYKYMYNTGVNMGSRGLGSDYLRGLWFGSHVTQL